MTGQYIIGVDQGTQSTKVTIFDRAGNEVCSHAVPLRDIELGAGGVAIHPDDDLWDSLQVACRDVLMKFNGAVSEIIGVGLGSIRCCRALLRADGELAEPVQSWMDSRLSRPYEHDNDAVRYVTTTTGYLTHRLTGEAKDTRSNYVGPWPIDPRTLQWYPDGEDFASYSTPRSMLFELVDPATVVGHVTAAAAEATGLPEGLPVVSTANDKAVEGLGAGLQDDGRVLVSLGTYITSMMAGEQNTLDSVHYFTNPGATPGEFMYESSGIRRGMTTVTWIKELMGSDLVREADKAHRTPEEHLNHLAAELPVGSGGLYTVLNWLASPLQPHERGMMIGFNGSHQGPHMFRSILEGIAMTMRNHAQAMCDERGVDLTRITVSGGGSNGDLFMQILADVFGVTATRNVVNGSASLGAAICCALALGVYPSRREAVEHMVRPQDTFEPCSDHTRLYALLNDQVYRHIAAFNDELLERSHEILTS